MYAKSIECALFYDHQEITKIITTHNGPENLLAIFNHN